MMKVYQALLLPLNGLVWIYEKINIMKEFMNEFMNLLQVLCTLYM